MGSINPARVPPVEGEQFKYTSDQRYSLGTLMEFPDGRTFRYVKVGASALIAGKIYQGAVPGANFDELAVAAAVAVGSRTVTVTNGATALTKDVLKDGYLNVEDDAGEGRLYKIAGNTADAGNGTVTITLAPGSSIQVALTTSTTVGIWVHPFSAIIVHPSPPTAKLAGLAVSAATALYYAWVQIKGPASVLTAGVVVITEPVRPSATVDGAVDPCDWDAAAINIAPVGHVMEVSADTEHSLIWLDIP